jgi:PhnB protein
MTTTVKPIPDGYHAVTPYLSVKDARAALAFYARAFGAKELFRLDQPDGRVGHAEIQIGDSRVMLADEFPEIGSRSPVSLGGTPVSLVLYVPDVDAVVKRAVEAGAKLSRPVANQFYGDRTGGVTDPFGHVWFVATHVEDVPPEEMARRHAAQTAAEQKKS